MTMQHRSRKENHDVDLVDVALRRGGFVMNDSRFSWQQGSPAEDGFDSKRLQVWQDELIRHNTKCLLLIRNDRIVLEWYAPGYA